MRTANSINRYSIQVGTLLRIYRQFKNCPNKVFLCSDFFKGGSKHRVYSKRYLGTLVKLGIIKIVPAIYFSGKNSVICRNVNGYKLIQKENLN